MNDKITTTEEAAIEHNEMVVEIAKLIDKLKKHDLVAATKAIDPLKTAILRVNELFRDTINIPKQEITSK